MFRSPSGLKTIGPVLFLWVALVSAATAAPAYRVLGQPDLASTTLAQYDWT